MHDGTGEGKKMGGTRSILPASESKKRGWIQRRMCELHHELYGTGSLVNNEQWTECYRTAESEWDER